MTMMHLLNAGQVNGYTVDLASTHPLHMNPNGQMRQASEKVDQSFAEALMAAVGDTNTLQVNAEKKMQQFVLAPDSVDIHDVTLALTKAETSLSLMKNVTDRVIQAYNTLSQMR